nr:hypothetical protein [Verrucomicrobiota bacterium]
GYAFALERNLIRADVDRMETLALDSSDMPDAVFVKPQVGYQMGSPSLGGGFQTVAQTRDEYYASTHLQTIQFEIARQVVARLADSQAGRARLLGRHQLFPQVYRLVDEYIRRRVSLRGADPRKLGLERYATKIVERLTTAIEPNDAQGEPPLLPILNRYRPIGSTAGVDFKTTKQCMPTTKSHIDQVAADTAIWEQAAAFRLEQSPVVESYAKNDRLDFVIAYDFLGVSHSYVPDFLVKLGNGTTLVLEIKGVEDDQDRAKHQAAKRWISAVNHWGKLGRWDFHVCRDPQMLGNEVAWISSQHESRGGSEA